MSDATLNDVIERLDRLEAALTNIADAIRAAGVPRAGAAPPAPVYAAPAAPPIATAPIPVAAPVVVGPPPIKVAPPARPVAPTGAEQKEEWRRHEEPKRDFNPYRERTDLVVPGPDATVTDMVTFLFSTVLSEEIEDMWGLLFKSTHSSQLQGPRSLDHFKAFSWHKARRSAAEYLDAHKNPNSFRIAYTEPAEIGPAVDRCRVFLNKSDGRMPAPVVFARDPRDGNAWRITQISI